MAPETLESISSKTLIYNNKTDVWTFGITVWEMYSQGRFNDQRDISYYEPNLFPFISNLCPVVQLFYAYNFNVR